jgi:hypothetical protein
MKLTGEEHPRWNCHQSRRGTQTSASDCRSCRLNLEKWIHVLRCDLRGEAKSVCIEVV